VIEEMMPLVVGMSHFAKQKASEAFTQHLSRSFSSDVGSNIISRNPFTSQLFIATTKTSLADILVQKQVEKKETIDWERNLAFTAFGFGYLGIAQWGIYVRGFSRIFPGMEKFCNQSLRDKLKNRSGLRQLFGQIGLDFVFIQPVIYWPTLYFFKECTQRTPEGGKRTASDVISGAITKIRANFWEDNLGMCAFWLPLDLVIYSVPIWLRLPLNHGISFVWCAVMSFWRGDA
jgi:hypothetical protein